MPSDEQVQRALELIRKPGGDANYVRFFSRLNDPAWIAPLREAGFFVNPPEPVPVGEGVSYPGWPESEYLLRIVDEAPEEVADVLADIKVNDNPRVHADLAYIAARLPSGAALAYVKKEMAWLGGRYHLALGLPDAIAQLSIHLAELGRTKRALELTRELIAVRVVPDTGETWTARVESRMDDWTYGELTSKLLLELQPRLGIGAVALVADILADALSLTSHEAPLDYSQIWRRSIEGDPEVHLDDPRQALITGLRNAAVTEADEDRERLEAVLGTLETHDWAVFRRLSLHILAQKSLLAPDVAMTHTLDREALNSVEAGIEYAALLRAVYPALDVSQREWWLDLIREGPTWPSRDPAEGEAKGISDEYYESYVASWQRNWYAQVRDYLEPVQVRELESLEDRYGPAQVPAATGEVTSWTGPTSPLSEQDLRERSATDIVEFILMWTPSGEPMSPSPEGLARLLTERVAAEPAAFADVAHDISKLEPTYVRATIQGFEKATKEGQRFPWASVIDLVDTAIKGRPIVGEAEGRWLDQDSGWGWTRGAVADLLTASLRSETLPNDLADRVWAVLEELSWDQDPTPDYEQRYGGSNMDPLTLSLNTTRGKAMHGVLAFALWRKKVSGDDAFSLSDVAVVAQNLEKHLDPAQEPSQTIRGVFGASLYQLLWLDRDWLGQHVADIFPTDEEHLPLRRAAWESYLSYGAQPYHLFPVLKDEYERAVGELPTQDEERSRMGRDPGLVLAEHLGVLYYNGRIDLAEGGLLDHFVERANTKEQAHLVDFLGRSLHQADDGALPSEVLERAVALWEWIVTKIASTNRSSVLAGFGWWYGANVLDRAWRNKQLIALLRMKVPVRPEFALVKALTQSSSEDLDTTLEAIYLYVQGDGDPWRLLSARDALRAILHLGAVGDQAQRAKARQVINLLATKGLMDFVDLMASDASQRDE